MITDVKPDNKEVSLTLSPSVRSGELATVAVESESNLALKEKRKLPSLLLTFTVIVPLFLAVLYNFIISSERFTSTAAFVVRENQASAGILSLVSNNSIGRSDDNSYAVVEYMQSRSVIEPINKDGFLSGIFARADLDIFSRFPTVFSGRTKDDLFQHFQGYIDVEFKQSTGVITLDVQAFSPEDAKALAERMLLGGEALVNTLNDRAREDSIRDADALVSEAVKELQLVQAKLTRFRNDEGLLDPSAEVSISNKIMTGTMAEISKADAQLSVLLSTAPDNPAIRQLQSKRDALEAQLIQQRGALVGGGDSLAKKIEAYEQVALERKLAEKTLLSAVASLATAKQNFQGKKIYLSRVVEPNRPDRFSHPRRFVNIFLVLLIGLAVYWIARSMMALVMEEV